MLLLRYFPFVIIVVIKNTKMNNLIQSATKDGSAVRYVGAVRSALIFAEKYVTLVRYAQGRI